MRRIYLLVQNDIRTGPFTLEELLQQPLAPEVLIWIIGQSEDWLSPQEIPDLQPYYIKSDDGSITVKESVLADIQTKRFREPQHTTLIDPSRSGVLDAHLLESMGDQLTAATASQPQVEKRKAQPQVEPIRVAAPTQPSVKNRNAENESLGEKEEDNLTIARKNWAMVGIAACLVLFVAWNALFNDGANVKAKPSYTANTTLPPTQPLATSVASIEEAPSPIDDQATVPVAEVVPIVVPSYTADPTSAASTDAFLDSVQRVLDSQDQLMAHVDEVYRKSFNQKRNTYTKSSYSPDLRHAAKASSKSSVAKQGSAVSNVPLNQQVDLKSRYILDKSKQVNSVELMVKNNSKEILKTVSVDVYYYKKGEKLLNKETIYFSNLYPKQSLTKSIAGNHKASSARFELGSITPGRSY